MYGFMCAVLCVIACCGVNKFMNWAGECFDDRNYW